MATSSARPARRSSPARALLGRCSTRARAEAVTTWLDEPEGRFAFAANPTVLTPNERDRTGVHLDRVIDALVEAREGRRMSANIGEAFLGISPSLAGFEAKLKSGLAVQTAEGGIFSKFGKLAGSRMGVGVEAAVAVTTGFLAIGSKFEGLFNRIKFRPVRRVRSSRS